MRCDCVENHVGALTIGQILDGVGEAFFIGHDKCVCAVFEGVGFATGIDVYRDHVSAHSMRQLDSMQANATTRTNDHDRLAEIDVGSLGQSVVRRHD
jgi:hypothetical protein